MNQAPKALIVDGEPFNVDYLVQELEECPYQIMTAFNGRDALEKIQSQQPDLVLLDLAMPVLDGFAFLEQVKSDSRLPEIPIIVVSAANDSRSIVKAMKQGADDCLTKPVDEVLLRLKVKEYLG